MIKHLKKQYLRYKAIRQLKEVSQVCTELEMSFKELGVTRDQRKQFWYDFIKHKEVREDMLAKLLEYKLKKAGVKI